MDIQSLAEEARARRISGGHHNDTEFPLSGYCFDNSFVMYNLLKEKGFNPELVVGATDGFSEDVLRESSIEEINTVEELAGQVHYWVEVEGKIVDIAPYDEEYRGSVYVSSELPPEYYRLDNSYKYAADVLDSAYSRRCSFCGGKNGHCGCSEEKE